MNKKQVNVENFIFNWLLLTTVKGQFFGSKIYVFIKFLENY